MLKIANQIAMIIAQISSMILCTIIMFVAGIFFTAYLKTQDEPKPTALNSYDDAKHYIVSNAKLNKEKQ